jgi:flagellar hook-length control protein FliK
MEMNVISQLLPILQAQSVKLGQGKGGGSSPEFAGLLAMLQGMPNLGPEAAAVALQLGGLQENRTTLLPELFTSLLPEAATAGGLPNATPEENKVEGVDMQIPGLLSIVPASQATTAETVADSGEDVVNTTSNGKAIPTVAVAVGEGSKAMPTVAVAVGEGSEAIPTVAAAVGEESGKMPTNSGNPEAKPLNGVAVTEAEIPAPAASEPKGRQDIAQGNGKDARQIPELPLRAAENARSGRQEQKQILPDRPQPPVHAQPITPFRAALQTPAVQFGKSQLGRADIVDQVLEKMVLTTEPDGDSTLFVRLRPAVLGEVEIRLRMENGQLTARIITENVHVKEALDAALGQVRQRLEAQQISVSEMTVSVGQEHSSRQGKSFHPSWGQHGGKGNGYGIVENEDAVTRPVSIVTSLLDMRA